MGLSDLIRDEEMNRENRPDLYPVKAGKEMVLIVCAGSDGNGLTWALADVQVVNRYLDPADPMKFLNQERSNLKVRQFDSFNAVRAYVDGHNIKIVQEYGGVAY